MSARPELSRFIPGAERRRQLKNDRALIEGVNGTEIMTRLVAELKEKGDPTAVVIEDSNYYRVMLAVKWGLEYLQYSMTPISKGIALDASGKFLHARFTGYTGSWHYIDRVSDILQPNRNPNQDWELYLHHLRSGGRRIEDMSMEEKLRLCMQMAEPMADYRHEHRSKQKIIYPPR